jgi:dTDP-4-amino-4,6-dideoxygalactose transaminase
MNYNKTKQMINVFGSRVGQEEIAAVTEVMQAQWMGFGKKVDEFEQRFMEDRKVENFLLVDSGSNALFMAIHLLDLPTGSEVILPSFTWVSCAQAVLLAGCKPVFADVDLATHNITAELIKPHINDNTGAIMVVHYAGKPVDMDPILDLGFPVIEDAAHAVDSYYRGKLCGSIGDVGIFSFDAVKNLTAVEGGGIITRKRELYERAKKLRYCGIGKSGFDSAVSNADGMQRWWQYHISEAFIKMLPTNIGAAVGVEQLKKLKDLQAHRKMIWDFYQKELADVSWLTLPVNPDSDETHSYFTYVICLEKHRDALAKYLLDNKIYTTLRYHPLHMNPLYGSHAVLPNSEKLNETALSIPIHPNLSMEDAATVVEKIKAFNYED